MKAHLILLKPKGYAMNIEVAYALEEKQTLLTLVVDEGATLKQAIELSGILDTYPQIDLSKDKTGVFGKIVKLNTVLRDKDRVEIYRPLIADPKKVRSERAAQGKKMRSGKKT
jgi:putative ubiquitin-RnfH superfamily antitoxin RatB of RatAB toxin-antitoxin module